MSDLQPSSAGRPSARMWAIYAAVLVCTVAVASSLTLLATRWLATPAVKTAPLAAPIVTAPAASASASPASPAAQAVRSAAVTPPQSTRLDVSRPHRLLSAVVPPSGATGADIPLPPQRYRAVLLHVSLQYATGPSVVYVRSDAENVAAVRVAVAGASSSATVVVQPGTGGALQVHVEGGGGQLTINRVGTFTPAQSSTAGRIIPLPADELLHLVPGTDGNDALLNFKTTRLPRQAGSVSAVLLRFAGEVGKHGGYAKAGPSHKEFDQAVYWGATASNDQIRYGFLVVPLYHNGVYLKYHAGTELNVDLVGYVTGSGSPASANGLIVPVPAKGEPGVRVTASQPQQVSVIPPSGLAGVTPDRVSAILAGLTAQGDAPGAVSLSAPGRPIPRFADLAPGATKRSALALAPTVNGAVTVSSADNADVILTVRLLILRG